MPSPVTISITLFLLTFLHEDVAIVTGSYFISRNELPISLAYVFLYLGIVSGDVILYLLGMAARRLPWAQKLLIHDKVTNFRQRLDDNLIYSILMVRLVPGLLAPTFLACGWFRLSFRVFLSTTMAAAAVYLVIMLALMLMFGEALLHVLGEWGWVLLLGFILVKTLFGMRSAARRRLRGAVTTDIDTGGIFKGLPQLSPGQRKIAPAERLPAWIFYAPVVLFWLIQAMRYRSLTLPTIANPCMKAGGLWGESKSELMKVLQGDLKEWLANYVTVQIQRNDVNRDQVFATLQERMHENGFQYPLVLKPDVGWQGYGVRKIENDMQLRKYLQAFPLGETLIAQEVISWPGEAGIYYIRMPNESTGTVTSLTFRYFPHVIGDGVSTVRKLILQDPRTRFKHYLHFGINSRHLGLPSELLNSIPMIGEVVRLSFIGSIRTGGLYQDASAYITPTLNDCIAQIAHALPEFYIGRFDVRFSSVESLQQGKQFKIIEINGAGSEPIHIWDPATPLTHAYRELFRYQSTLFKIAEQNRRRGYKPDSLLAFLRLTLDYGHLLKRYPASS